MKKYFFPSVCLLFFISSFTGVRLETATKFNAFDYLIIHAKIYNYAEEKDPRIVTVTSIKDDPLKMVMINGKIVSK